MTVHLAGRVGPLSRLFSGMVALMLLAVLVTAASLQAAPDGYGTHVQLGLSACQWAVRLGKPCPTCGMTTAFAHAAHGNLWQAAATQPMGAILCVGASSAVWIFAYVAATGSGLGRVLLGWVRPPVVWAGLVLFLGAWAYKAAVWRG